MTAAPPRRAFSRLCGVLIVLTLACAVGQRFYAASAPVPASALMVLVDELVELHRQALTGAGDGTAVYRSWHDLRAQLAILAVEGRTHRGSLLVRVRIADSPDIAVQLPTSFHYKMTPREDEAWDIAPLASRLAFWFP